MHKLDDTLPRVVWIRCDPLLRSIFLGRFPPGYSPRDIPRTTLFLVFALRLISFLYEAASRRRNGRQGGTRLRTPDEPILNASHESNVKYIFKKKRMYILQLQHAAIFIFSFCYRHAYSNFWNIPLTIEKIIQDYPYFTRSILTGPWRFIWSNAG